MGSVIIQTVLLTEMNNYPLSTLKTQGEVSEIDEEVGQDIEDYI